MLWLTVLLLVPLAHLSGAKVFTQLVKPVTTPRTDYVLQKLALEGSGANVSVEYQQKAYEWYLVDISVGTPRTLLTYSMHWTASHLGTAASLLYREPSKSCC